MPISCLARGSARIQPTWASLTPCSDGRFAFADTDLSKFTPAAKIGLGVVGFIWLNTTAARAIHFYAGVDYPIERIFETDTFQTTASILWTLVAVSLMGYRLG